MAGFGQKANQLGKALDPGWGHAITCLKCIKNWGNEECGIFFLGVKLQKHGKWSEPCLEKKIS